ncbi:tandem-95 repeat protein, partial [Candidatus Poribacteria bacterium]|nr:tandem-95 repeat protein [Candidatus Poribacteria bacterium]
SPHANAYSQDFIITVVPVNDTSTADSTTSTTDEDVAVSIPLTGTDLDGDLLSFLLWDGQGGVLTDVLSLNGGVVSLTDANPEDNAATATYTPAADFYGDDTFLFIVSDGTLDSATATVTITVDPLPDVPIATDAAVTTPEETAVDVVLTGLDPDGDPVTVLLFDGEIAGTADITSLNGGTVSISGTADDQATATYTPPAQFSGVDTFEFVVNDAVSDSLAATVTVTVEAVNDPPTVAAVTATTAEDTPASIPLTGDDLDGDLLTVLLWDRSVGTELDVTSVNGGIVSIAATGENAATATYTPPQDFVGSDTFEYIANDGSEDSAAATATVTVTAVNDAPAVSAVTATTAEDTPVDVPLVGLDVDGDALTLLLWDVEFTTLGPVTTANGGTVEVGATTADQAIATYTPATDFVGTDTFEFLANDGVLDGEVATVTVTVEAVNDAPSATAASGATAEDTPVAFDLTGSDIDGDAIVVLLWDGAAGVTTDVSSANGGVVSIGATSGDTATVTYTPVADFSGSDTFEFIVSDGVLDSATAVATITVDPVDDPPVADDPVGPFAVTETTTLDITLTGTDIDSEAVSFSFYDGVLPTPLLVLTTANGGQLVLVDGDAFDDAATATYSPPAGFDGIDSFEFVVEDETSQSAPVSVSISVASTNDAPAASATTASTSEGTPVDISLTGTDVDGNVLTVLLWDGAQGVVEDITSANGGLVSLGDADPSDSIATATYTPGADYSGTDTFEFVVNDGTVDSATATVTVTVDAVQDAPVATPAVATTLEDQATDILLSGTDADGDVVTVLLWDGAAGVITDLSTDAGGTVSIGETTENSATATYTPPTDFNGADSFEFVVNDGSLDSAVETVTITVDPVNDLPIALDEAFLTSEDTPVTFTLFGSDDDLDVITLLLWDGAQGVAGSLLTAGGGTVGVGTSSNGQASVTYTPRAEFAGQDSFEYVANDGLVDSAVARVTITVSAVNDAPLASDVTAQTTEDNALNFALTGIDADFDALSVFLLDSADAQVATLTTANGATVTLDDTAIPVTGADGVSLEQYATSVLAFSSEYSSGSWGAAQALGAPDTGAYGDLATAWSPSAANGGIEYLAVGYDTPVYAEGVVITETYGNGFVFQVDAIEPDGAAHTVWSGSDTSAPNAPVDFAVTWPRTTFLVSGVQIWVDTDHDLTAAEEVDAIRLLGSADAPGVDYVTATYTPAPDYSGDDSFQYVVSDGIIESDAATVTVTILAVNDLPVASPASATTDEDTAVDILLTGSDPEGGALAVLLWNGASTDGPVTTAAGGSVTLDVTTDDQATATYTPFGDFAGDDSFEFVVNDGTADSEPVTVSVTVTPVNDAPLTDALTAQTTEDTAVDIVLTGVDADGDPVTVLLSEGGTGVASDITTANGGTVSIGATTDGQATAVYTPAPDFSGSDTFDYIVTDGTLGSDPATVTVAVDAADDPPTADAPAGPLAVTEGATLDIDLSGSDVDSVALAFALADGVSTTGTTANGGLVTLFDADPADALATATYVPPSAFDGVDAFEFVVSDGVTTSDGVTVSITVTSLPLLTVADVTVGEADGVATLTAALSAVSAQVVSVTYTTSDSTAVAASDYSGSDPTTITIPAGEASVTFDIPITSDTVNEADETFTVALSDAANAALANDGVTVTIADDDDITLSIADVTVSEADESADFIVTASGATEQAVTVDFVTEDGLATAPADYTATTLAGAELDPSTGELVVQVALTDDATNEATEEFTATIGNATGRGVTIDAALATATVLDDDGLSLSIVDVSVAEADGEASIEVSLSQESDQEITVAYATVDGEATAGTDYGAVDSTLTFVAGSVTQTLYVDILDDSVNEADEAFTLQLTDAVGDGVTVAVDAAIVTIGDDDDVVIDLADVSVNETDDGDTQVVSVPLTLSGESDQTIAVDVEVYGVTATDGTDFDAIAGTYTLFPDGTMSFESATAGTGSVGTAATSFTADVSVFGDALNEADETISVVAFTPVGRGVTVGVDVATVTILDNDDVTLSIDDVSIAEDDATGVATFTLTLSGPSEQEITVDVGVQGSGDVPATLDADFAVQTPQALVLAAATTTQTLDVTIIDDAVHEGDETFEVTLTAPNARGVTLLDEAGLGTILDGESVTAAISDAAGVEGDDAGVTMAFDVTLTGPSEQAISLDFAVAGSATGGATTGVDFTAPAATTVTFAAGETVATIDVSILGDTLNEADESLTVTVSNPSDASVGITDDVGEGVIHDNDDVTLSISSAQADEGDADTSTVGLEVTLSGESEQSISVGYAVADGTATAGVDYASEADATLTLAPGETTASITLTVNGDTAHEADETVSVTLTDAVGRGVTVASASTTATATILNDDPLPALTISDVTVTEGSDAEASLTVTLTGETEQAVTVNYATADATANAGSDYIATSGALTLEPGTATATVVVTLVDDVLAELSESFLVNLSGVANATVGDGQAFVAIENDDAAASLTILSPVEGQEFVAGVNSVDVVVSIANHVGGWRWKMGSEFLAADAADGELAEGDTVILTGLADGEAYKLYVTLVGEDGLRADDAVPATVVFAVDRDIQSDAREFVYDLPAGLSMIGLTLDPLFLHGAVESINVSASGMKASHLVQLGATLVMRLTDGVYETLVGRDGAVTIGADFAIEPGSAYVVNVQEATSFTLEGLALGAALADALLTAPTSGAEPSGVWAFAAFADIGDVSMPPDAVLLVSNARTGVMMQGRRVGDGRYLAATADLSRAPVVEEGDLLRLEWVTGAGYRLGVGTARSVTGADLVSAYASIHVDARPRVARALPNYPNPFNPETWLPFELNEASGVSVVIYDIRGRVVRSLDLGRRSAGYHVSRDAAAYWDGRNELGESVGSGVYFYELRAGSGRSLGSMTILK